MITRKLGTNQNKLGMYNISDSLETRFDLPQNLSGIKSKVYQLYNDDYTIYNNPNEPEKIKISENSQIFINNYKFPPRSFTLFEIPVKLDLGVSSINDRNQFISLYPNPVNDIAHFTISESYEGDLDVSNVKIYNILGVEVTPNISSITIHGNSGKINISNLNKGLYFIRIGNQISKFIKI